MHLLYTKLELIPNIYIYIYIMIMVVNNNQRHQSMVSRQKHSTQQGVEQKDFYMYVHVHVLDNLPAFSNCFMSLIFEEQL